jgi:hypothetical protein
LAPLIRLRLPATPTRLWGPRWRTWIRSSRRRRLRSERRASTTPISYLTQELIDEGERDARDPEEIDQGEDVDEETLASAGNRLWNVWFTGGPGSAVYGYLLSGGTCSGSWYVRMTWNERSVVGKCTNRNSYIWYVS